MKQKLKSTQYYIGTGSNSECMLEILKKLSGKKEMFIPENGKVKFSGHIDIELDFNNEIENYYFSNIKPL
ncbi:MAG: hypothetical protein IIB02_08330 [Thaumarchaeota archaeon]|nr:hypothetical protein [Nitrososphaerota archaeon]